MNVFSKVTAERVATEVKSVTMIAFVMTIIMSFIEIPVLMTYYAVKFITAWIGAAFGFMLWHSLVWAWNKFVSN